MTKPPVFKEPPVSFFTKYDRTDSVISHLCRRTLSSGWHRKNSRKGERGSLRTILLSRVHTRVGVGAFQDYIFWDFDAF